MGLSGIALGAGLAVVGAVISRLLADEATPWIVGALIRRAVDRLPEEQKERREEEWRSHVNDIPGDLGKIVTTLGFAVASHHLRRLSGKSAPGSAFKRSCDILGAIITLAMVAPPFCGAALLIKVLDGGPVFSRHRRIGPNGRPFDYLKFRTVAIDSDEIPRTTMLGGYLCYTQMDELPTLLNILKGEMSLWDRRDQL